MKTFMLYVCMLLDKALNGVIETLSSLKGFKVNPWNKHEEESPAEDFNDSYIRFHDTGDEDSSVTHTPRPFGLPIKLGDHAKKKKGT